MIILFLYRLNILIIPKSGFIFGMLGMGLNWCCDAFLMLANKTFSLIPYPLHDFKSLGTLLSGNIDVNSCYSYFFFIFVEPIQNIFSFCFIFYCSWLNEHTIKIVDRLWGLLIGCEDYCLEVDGCSWDLGKIGNFDRHKDSNKYSPMPLSFNSIPSSKSMDRVLSWPLLLLMGK